MLYQLYLIHSTLQPCCAILGTRVERLEPLSSMQDCRILLKSFLSSLIEIPEGAGCKAGQGAAANGRIDGREGTVHS